MDHLKVKGQSKANHANANHKKVGVTIFVSDKVDLGQRLVSERKRDVS